MYCEDFYRYTHFTSLYDRLHYYYDINISPDR